MRKGDVRMSTKDPCGCTFNEKGERLRICAGHFDQEQAKKPPAKRGGGARSEYSPRHDGMRSKKG